MNDIELSILTEKYPDAAEFEAAKKRLTGGEPLAYIIGEWYFRNETYKVTSDVLIPQPDTEHLVEWAGRLAPKGGSVLDLCTGSGCIPVSLLRERPDLNAVAVELYDGAIEVARENSRRNGTDKRLEIIKADVLAKESAGIIKAVKPDFDILVSNPPYIRTNVIETLSDEVKREPIQALDGGCDGLVFYRAILGNYIPLVKAGGYIILEIGYDQGEELKNLCASLGLECEIKKDYSNNDRVVIIHLN